MSFGDLDDRALDALKEFEVEGGVCVLRQLASDGAIVTDDGENRVWRSYGKMRDLWRIPA